MLFILKYNRLNFQWVLILKEANINVKTSIADSLNKSIQMSANDVNQDLGN